MLCRTAGDQGLENMRVADLLGAAHRLLKFEAIHHGLHGGVGGPFLFRKRFLQFTDGGWALGPESLHDPEFQPGQFWRWHRKVESTTICCSMQANFWGNNWPGRVLLPGVRGPAGAC